VSTPRRQRPSSHIGLRRELIDAVGVLLTQARSALFITGPGLSADSGLPHYRGIAGLQRKKPEDGKAFEAALSAEMLARRPEVTWKTLRHMERVVREALPNRGHEVISQFEKELRRTLVMTQNIDYLHQRAGSRNVIEMHGALHKLRCTRCEITERVDSYEGLPMPPLCANCGSALRPDMVLFGEALPPDPFTDLQVELDQGFDIVISVGIGTMYPYIARPMLVAKAEGIPTIEIGATQTDLSDVVDFKFRGNPAKLLAMIWDVYLQVGPRHTRVD
jgi:NAD-dependent deacetylase